MTINTDRNENPTRRVANKPPGSMGGPNRSREVRNVSHEGACLVVGFDDALVWLRPRDLCFGLLDLDGDPLLALFRNRTFSGGNAVTLMSFMVSAGAFLFLVVQLQTTLGFRPVSAGAAFVPLYLIMLVGSPQSGRLADKIGARVPIVAGNLILAAGTWWLSLVGAGSEFLPDILPGIIVLALGLATLGAPLTSATLGAVGEHDQGIASGVNNTVGQLAGLLMIVVLPAVAGLSGKAFDSPEFADGYQLAMRACTLLCLVAAGIAGVTIRSGNAPTDHQPRRL